MFLTSTSPSRSSGFGASAISKCRASGMPEGRALSLTCLFTVALIARILLSRSVQVAQEVLLDPVQRVRRSLEIGILDAGEDLRVELVVDAAHLYQQLLAHGLEED